MSVGKLITLLTLCVSVAVVLAAPATELESKPGFAGLFCESCKSIVEQAQANMDQVRPQLDQLCNYCGSPEADQKCRDKLHELEDKVATAKPQDLCASVGLCHPHPPQNDAKTFYDFTGQF